ncbi:SPOR domain-containing protein [Alphaproteobacteria bacterium KMM 3653]|uniref:SPOR domain-containing protein n=1 Tax=Harenicola maris TaxID=2841044 RepID=A0AAP2CQB5_9RHOB|nr:SPOR domain-containing protein [Harenicola maris]
MGTTGVSAQTLRNADEPAEFPPASFKGNQFADSRGCVYVRAGFGGQVRWVPRVTRSRKVVCDVAPTFAPKAPEPAPVVVEAKPAPTPAPETKPAPKPEPKVAEAKPAPAAKAPAAKAPVRTARATPTPAPQPQRVTNNRSGRVGKPIPTIALTTTPPKIGPAAEARQQAAAQQPQRRVPRAAPAKPSPADPPTVFSNNTVQEPAPNPAARQPRVVAARPSPSPAPGPTVYSNPVEDNAPRTGRRSVRSAGANSCPERSGVSARYTNSSGVRCGPQDGGSYAAAPAPARRAPVQAQPVTTNQGRVASAAAPAPVYGKKRTAIPAGEFAGIQNKRQKEVVTPRQVASAKIAKGYAPAFDDGRFNPNRGLPRDPKLALLWTQESPRRLIDVTTGREVSAKYPDLRYPYVSMVEQNAAEANAARTTVATKQQTRTRARVATKTVPQAQRRTTQKPATKVRVKKAAPSQGARAASHRYVQVGTFGVPANAKGTAAKLHGLGLPVRLAPMTSKGRQLQIVLAGPFKTQDQLNQALRMARSAGFGDAFLRK